MEEMSQKSRRRGARRSVLGGVLMLAVIAAAVLGYMAWRDAFANGSSDGEPVAAAEEQPSLEEAEQVLAEIEGSAPTPAASPSSSARTVERATQAVARVAEQQGGIDQRLAAAEQRLARLDLQSQATAGNTARAEGLLIAFATRRAIERGVELGFLADQLRLRFGDALPNAVRTIVSASRDPVTLDRLLARLDGLGPDLEQPDAAPSLDRIRREIGNLFVIRRESSPSPQPGRRLERARLFLETGRYEAAIEEVQNMPGAENAQRWIADTRRYAAVQRALDLIETSAVLEPARLRDGAGNVVSQPSPAETPAN